MSASANIDDAQWREALQTALLAATRDVFPTAGLEQARFGIRTENERIAVLSFHGDNAEGSIGLAVNEEFLVQSHPVPEILSNTNTDELEDWLGELLNRIVGRLKAHLSHQGVDVGMGTPVVLRGASLMVRPQADTRVCAYAFKGADQAYVWSQLRLSRTQVTRGANEPRYAAQGVVIRL